MFNSLIEIFATVLDIVYMVWFITKLNHITINDKKWTLIFPSGALIFQLIGDRFLPTFDIFYAMVVLVLTFVYSMIICHRKIARAVLSVCLYYAGLMIVGSVYASVFPLFIENVDLIIMGSDSIIRVIYLITGKISQFAVLKLLLHIFRAADILDLKNGLLCFSFNLISMVGLGALLNVIITTDNNAVYISVFVAIFVIALSNVAFYVVIYQIQKLLKYKYELKLMRERMEFEASKIEESNIVWENIRKVRHDIKNHLTVVSAQLNGGMIEECKEYVKKIVPSVDNMGNLICSNNSVMDYLINSKLSGLKDINVKITGCIGKMDDIEDTDIACIMGNILDNAIEAQGYVNGEKRIEIVFMLKNNSRIIICKNTVSTPILKNNKHLKSTKKNPEDHGIGHKIVKSVVNKYNGIVDYFEEDEMFGVQIILPEKI